MFFSRNEEDRKAAYHKGAWDDVIRFGEKELKKDPKNIKVLNDLACAYYMKRDYEHAVKLCENIYRIEPKPDLHSQAKKIGPRYMRYHEILAEIYFQQGKDKEALAICDALKELTSIFSKKHTIAAQVHVRRGNIVAAAKEYGLMARNCPDHLKKAFSSLVDLAKLNPLVDTPYRELYALYIQRNELPKVISRLEGICESRQADDGALYSLAYMYYFSGSYDKEIALLRQRSVSHPDNSHLHFFLAKAYQAKKEFEKARQHIERAMALAPQYTDQYSQLRNTLDSGEVYTMQRLEAAVCKDVEERRLYKAIEGYEQLLEKNPNHQPYWIGLAKVIDMATEVEVAGGDLEKAFEHLDQLALFREIDSSVEGMYERRNAQLAPMRIEYYEGLIRKGGKTDGEMGRMHLALAQLYTEASDSRRAAQHWNAAIKAGGSAQAEAVFQFASHLLQSGKVELAEPYIQQFVSFSCENEQLKEWMYALGVASEEAGLRAQARNLFGKLCRDNEAYKDTEKRLAALNQRVHSVEVPEAVMVLDICESSRMMDLYGDEITNRMKNMLEEDMFPIFEKCGSKFCKSTGDGFLVTFPKVDQGVKAAINILLRIDEYNSSEKNMPVHLRFAVHFGAVRIRQDDDRHGTNVNIPFRVEGLKGEGLIEVEGGMKRDELPTQDRILITEAAYQRLQMHKEYSCRYVGLFELRNITGVHKIYQVLSPKKKV